jgi:hypothetical protein
LPQAEVGERRVPYLPNEDAQRILESLSKVGPNKPVGYLPLYTIRDVLKGSVEEMIAAAAVRGLARICLPADRCCIKSGALYVYDRDALAELLKQSRDVLAKHHLAMDPDRFVLQIAARWFEREHPLYRVIAAAFGEGVGEGGPSGSAAGLFGQLGEC